MSNSDILILNVDDNDGARYVKTRILQGAGFQVAEAANGTDALTMARRLLPALVLLDVKLPDINGIEVCRQIKSDVDTCAILVLQTSAALTGRDDKIRGLEGGADNYLAAPIEADELIANVNALLRLQRTQADLRNSEERFRQLTDNIEDVFWMFSLDGSELLYVSNAYATMWNRPAQLLERAPGDWLDAIHADDRAAVAARWQLAGAGEPFDEEYRLTVPGAGVRWVRDRAFLVRDAADVPYRIARITSDITQRRDMEDRLHAADDNKNDFLATLAHELRNPLSPIRNAVALMGEVAPGDVALHQKARQIIVRQVAHLSRLVDDLLDVARISQGKLTLQLQRTELHAVVDSALETAQPMLESRQHRLVVDVPPEPLWINGDAVRLAQAIGNLLHNAAKFTNRGGEVRLQVARLADARVSISVHDNGIGITSYNLPRIFNMFAQGAAAHDRVHDGLGIGLSLVSTLAHMHGGSVHASSPGIDHGSTFELILPLLDATATGAAPVPQDTANPALAPGMRRVLLVDDNIDSSEVMGELLGVMGHEVFLANDADRALALARAHRPDTIILDIGMPKVDGYALARMLRDDPLFATTRLIAHTGYGSDPDRQKTRAAGFDFHLVKPANFDELERSLRPSQVLEHEKK
ncbi:UNVERIFIED_ORG: PAS domain S-box-containing protein [Zoogloea ramigera]|uniref:histidine kinase n=1 Tax=Duganella zoogloeoides TaxID=75659 RepID=A0ABZ0Y598_9BURK|nr:response regulator [Duganella zoogloeoides]WQH06647.1 response regulator [Duganella zoogloeoides]